MRLLQVIYRILLFGCPTVIRREYGRQMEEIFIFCLRTAWDRRGPIARLLTVARGLADVVLFALQARRHHWGSATEQERHPTRRRPTVLMRDIRGTLRLVRNQPVMAAAIVFMFALGIGATTAIFSVVHGVLLRPLPFPDADQIVQIYGTRLDRGWTNVTLTEANFWDMRDRSRAFEEFGALHFTSFSLTGFDHPEHVTAGRVSSGFFRALGVQPAAGRIFDPREDQPGKGDGLVLLSHIFWSRRFGTDRSVIGRGLTLDGRSYTVIGILPPGSPWLDAADVFIPLMRRPDANRGSFEYTGIARLKGGVDFDAAVTDLQRVAKELEMAYPDVNKGLGATMRPSRTWVASDDLRRTLWILLGAVGLLLVIACVNVTNLLLARASARARDNALRTALGASRGDLIRERLTESLFYSVSGTLVGLLLANWMLATLKAMNPGGIPRLGEVAVDPWVMAFAGSTALLVGIAIGLIPALRTPIGNVIPALRGGQRGMTSDRPEHRIRSIFVAAEVALSLILLIGAGLLVRSLLAVLSVDRGFHTENRMVLTVTVPRSLGPQRMQQVNRDILTRLHELPMVLSAAAVSGRPLSAGSTGLGLAAADQTDTPDGQVPWGTWRIVTEDYFKTMGLPLISGRSFTEHDQMAKPWRAVISKRVAELLWPGQDAIGRTIILWKGQSDQRSEVIGVVADMRERGLENDPTLAVYFPAYGTAMASMQVVLHTRGRPQDMVPAVRTAVAGGDVTLPISNVRTLEEIVTASVATRRMTMMLLVIFASLALVLALAGVYGVIAYSVARRTSEIGVRIALGAEHRNVLRLVFTQGMQPVFAGAVIGGAAMFWLSRLMAAMLFRIKPHDPLTYAAVVAALLAVGAVACYVPARRVLAVDPATALRTE